MALEDELRPLETVNFRDIYHKFVYINCRTLLDEMFPGEVPEFITGMVAYCYIDRTEGLSFSPLFLAVVKADAIQVLDFPHLEDTMFVIRLRSGEVKMSELHDHGHHLYLYALNPEKYSFFDMSIVNFDDSDFQDFKNMIDEQYDADQDVENLRSDEFSFLDEFRNPSYPDDVTALLYNEDKGIEQVWVRLNFAAEHEIFGELLNEPYNDYGCHEGTIIGLSLAKAGDEHVLIFNGQIAEMQ